MQKKFHTSAGLSEAEIALKNWGIKYKKQPDGSILVPRGLIIYASRGSDLKGVMEEPRGAYSFRDNLCASTSTSVFLQ